MGTKAALAEQIAKQFQSLPNGPLLEVFAGMSAVGRATACSRNLWVNDIQAFAHTVNEYQFTSDSLGPSPSDHVRRALREFSAHRQSLNEEFKSELSLETTSLACGNWKKLTDIEEILRNRSNISTATDQIKIVNCRSYRLFADIYAGTYFGISQCIEIDALRKGIDLSAPQCESSMHDVRQWMLAALGAAVSRCSNSTGHFAQYLTASDSNFNRVLGQRKKSIVREWLKRLRLISPVGSAIWRRGNRVYRSDACSLLKGFSETDVKPAVVYADPPYTSDQYSRYYHVLDTLILYDNPIVTGKAKYRPNRFVSDWSLKSRVKESFELLISHSCNIGASLVISYPENGLLENSKSIIPVLMSERYKNVRVLDGFNHHHSTMGGSKGRQRNAVTERLFIASI